MGRLAVTALVMSLGIIALGVGVIVAVQVEDRREERDCALYRAALHEALADWRSKESLSHLDSEDTAAIQSERSGAQGAYGRGLGQVRAKEAELGDLARRPVALHEERQMVADVVSNKWKEAREDVVRDSLIRRGCPTD